jgi:hypothetical protein
MVARKLLILLRVILAQTGFSSTGTTAGVCDASGLAVRISNAKSTAYAAKRAILPVLWRTPETLSAQILQLDDLLRRYGPEAQPARDALKDMVIIGYDRVWQVGGGNPRGPAIEDIQAGIDRMFAILDSMRQKAPDPRAYMLADAASLTAAINSQRLQMVLQLSNSLSWPFMAILVSWTCLLFFGFGMVSRVNRTTVVGLAAGSLTVASAIFLIAELNTPFSGLLRLSPEPIVRTIAALGK